MATALEQRKHLTGKQANEPIRQVRAKEGYEHGGGQWTLAGWLSLVAACLVGRYSSSQSPRSRGTG
jgi:hypothetical protein